MNSVCFLRHHLDWPNLLAGLILGAVVEYLVHAIYHQRQALARTRSLRKKYGKLARTYLNFRADGTPTGGSVELIQNRDGSFKIIGRHADRSVDWESDLRMDDKYDNHGIGYYRHQAGMGYGAQILWYIPETDTLHVKGVRESPGPPLEFFHTWPPKPN